MDNQDQYIKMVFQNAVEKIRAFGATLEELQMDLAAKKSYKTKIACVGSLPDFENMAKHFLVKTIIYNGGDEAKFEHNGIIFQSISETRPKGYYPKCDAILFLGGYLNPRYTQIIDDLESQQQIYLIDPIQLLNLIK